MMRNLILLLGLIGAMTSVAADADLFVDPLDLPASVSNQPGSSVLLGGAIAGKRMVAVGAWGRILLSDEQGQNWKQVLTPVSSDLTAVTFATATSGWAVGHDGVVLHSEDGGQTWKKQLDGRDIAAMLVPYYQKREQAGDPAAAEILDEMTELASEPPAFPLMDVWFRNEREGFVVGAFNLILHTRDAGVTWQPWMERTDNPRRYHLYSIRGDGDDIYVAGELGLLLKLDDSAQRFAALPSPYDGSFFGVIAQDSRLIAFGLRGNAYQSLDAGQSWRQLENDSETTLIAGTFLPGGKAVLLDQEGFLHDVSPELGALRRLTGVLPFPAFSLVAPEGTSELVLVGPAGARSVPRSDG